MSRDHNQRPSRSIWCSCNADIPCRHTLDYRTIELEFRHALSTPKPCRQGQSIEGSNHIWRWTVIEGQSEQSEKNLTEWVRDRIHQLSQEQTEKSGTLRDQCREGARSEQITRVSLRPDRAIQSEAKRNHIESVILEGSLMQNIWVEQAKVQKELKSVS